MSIPTRSLRIRSLLALIAVAFTTALRPADLEPGSGVIILTLMNSIPKICVGDSAPIEIFMQDAVYGLPPGGTYLTMTSRLAASISLLTLGGPISLTYTPEKEGSDTIEINAINVYSTPGVLSIPVIVEKCGWSWKLSYSGTYPNPKGFWTYYEDASVKDGTLKVEANGSGSDLIGEGTVVFSVDLDGSNPTISCALDNAPEGAARVNVRGTLARPGSGSMLLHFSFESIKLPGGGKIPCQVLGNPVTMPYPLPGTSVDLGSLVSSEVIVSTNAGSYSQPVTTALVWQLPGSGSLEIHLTPLSP
jgi:hypothetical protein